MPFAQHIERAVDVAQRAREAQAVRIAADPTSDVSRIDMTDMQAAMEER